MVRTLGRGLLPMVYHPRYSFEPWPAAHRFRMSKFRDLHDHLLRERIAQPSQMHRPIDDPPDEWFTSVHDENYYLNFVDGTLPAPVMRRIGVEWSAPLVERTRLECAGTVLAAQLALRHGMACHLGGGTHHAHHDFGSGFTILNDLAVAARFVQRTSLAARVLIVDLDVVRARRRRAAPRARTRCVVRPDSSRVDPRGARAPRGAAPRRRHGGHL
jgi:acetoin utilization deacetylase AcuC-like enzyme